MKILNNYTTKSRWSKALAAVLALVIFLGAYVIADSAHRARAESLTSKAWILCKSYVNIRLWPNKRATEVGQLDAGDWVEIDGRTKDGYAHIVSPVDGWVHAGYITFSAPEQRNTTATVTAPKRVYCRKWIDGPKVDSKPWLITGSEVKVYWTSDDWALTNRGYIKAEYLEMDP